jgi:anthranilate synthase component 1
MSRGDFEDKVRRIKEYITAGEAIQVVLSQRLAQPTHADPFDIYRALRTINPSPYMFFLDFKDFHIIGASPEILVRVEDGAVMTRPLAGTRPRGKDPAEDSRLDKELRSDEKERAEHIMLVDLGRNDIGRVSQPGTVEVSDLMDVERYSHVMHLVSHVQGRLRGDMTPLDALRACFPAGTVSGAPKIRAMEIIAELETEKRGPYAGAVGYLSFSGNMDMAIAIRTMVVNRGIAYTQAGCGVVYDSIPEKEYEESMNKAGALLKAVSQAEDTGPQVEEDHAVTD